MPYLSDRDIYTDVDPALPNTKGETFDVPPVGGFTLIGKGGVIEDDLAERFGLKGDLKKFDEAKHREEIEKRNVATYEQNAGASKAHQGYPAPAKSTDVLDAKPLEPRVDVPAVEGTSIADPDAPRRGRPPASPAVIR